MKHKSILVTAPSGAGKTTLVKRLLSEFDFLEFSISATTRRPRENEINGIDYYFISESDFKTKISQNEFIEWEEVYSGHLYGTLKSEIEKIHSHGKIPLFDIDIKGAMNIKKNLSNDVLSIFISPPNLEILEERLRHRNTETEDKIKERLFKAMSEMKFVNFFDKKIINDDVDKAYEDLKSLIKSYLA